jgi:hypothetical protein
MTCDASCVCEAAVGVVGTTLSLAFLVGFGGRSVAANVDSGEDVSDEGVSAEGEWCVRCVGAGDCVFGFVVAGHGIDGRAGCGGAGEGGTDARTCLNGHGESLHSTLFLKRKQIFVECRVLFLRGGFPITSNTTHQGRILRVHEQYRVL